MLPPHASVSSKQLQGARRTSLSATWPTSRRSGSRASAERHPEVGSCLFEQFVGSNEHRQRWFEPEGLGSFQVDKELDFRRLLDGEIVLNRRGVHWAPRSAGALPVI